MTEPVPTTPEPSGGSAPLPTLRIRPAVPDDAPLLAAFNRALALETEDRELDPATVAAGVARLFEQPELGFYSVAEHPDDGVVGCVLVTYEWSDWRNGLFWWIQSVYVRPDHRRRGIFRALHAHLGRLAKSRGGICGFRLYVEASNERARRTYAALGLEETGYRLLEREH